MLVTWVKNSIGYKFVACDMVPESLYGALFMLCCVDDTHKLAATHINVYFCVTGRGIGGKRLRRRSKRKNASQATTI